MRQYKFRAKNIETGEWIVGENIHFIYEDGFPEKKCIMVNSDTPFEALGDGYIKYRPSIVDTNTVGQFTGLTDKNGKEIYEGDILETNNYPGEDYYIEVAKDDYPPYSFIRGWRKKYNSKVVGMVDKMYEVLESDSFLSEDLKIIGNIYENPDLLF